GRSRICWPASWGRWRASPWPGRGGGCSCGRSWVIGGRARSEASWLAPGWPAATSGLSDVPGAALGGWGRRFGFVLCGSGAQDFPRVLAGGAVVVGDRNRVRFQHRRQLPLPRSEEHTSELQSRENLVCRLLLA